MTDVSTDHQSSDRRVLVVDDDEDVRTLRATMLALDGFSVVAAANGRDALTLAREHQPGVILLDWMMPVMDGAAFRVEQLKDASIAAIPVVVVSAAADIARATSRAMGAAGCLDKPFDPLELTTAVGRCCGVGLAQCARKQT
jgi:CheY-like chemotaxis protein